jgi:DsbC/DsbD-like thiol-disulfide interchange protein
MLLNQILTIPILLLLGNVCNAQRAPVTWTYEAERLKPQEWRLKLQASLAPGWHIYSQHLKEGGPIPTLIRTEPNQEYSFVGKAEEKGKPVQFYDSIYEMEITWYAEQVSFVQKIIFDRITSEINGTVEYMVCDSHQCLPQEEKFTINLQP